jgi:predicted  nucleic acid-binding Zn-ribbon protein
MTKASPLFLAIILFSTAGMYGCTQQKNSAAGAKLRDVETRFTKLEEDYRAVAAVSEAQRKKLTQAEADKAELAKEVEELKAVKEERDELRKERDELRKQLVARTGERDNVTTQLTQFRQDLQALVNRVDAAMNTPGTSAAPVTAVPASRKSE